VGRGGRDDVSTGRLLAIDTNRTFAVATEKPDG
jgi:hypothetical protein